MAALSGSSRRLVLGRRAGVVVALGLVAALGVGSYRALSDLDDASDWRAHSHVVIVALDSTQLGMAHAELEVRAYALEPSPGAAARFDEAVAEVHGGLAQLGSLVADNAAQTERMAALARVVNERLAVLDASMERLQASDLAGSEVPALDTSYDAAFRDLAAAERTLRQDRGTQGAAATAVTRTSALAGTVLALALLGLLFFLVEREIGQRQRAQDDTRRAADELKATYTLARAAQEQLDQFFVLSVDMLAIASTDGFFKRLSPAFDVLGYDSGELLAKPFLDFVHSDDRERTLAEVAKLATGVPTIHFENRYRCKDGSYRWLEWAVAPTKDGVLYATARDVTDAKLAHLELQRAKEAADGANRELEAFSYSVSHDLRSPLRAVDGFAAALAEDYEAQLDPQARDYLGRIRAAAKRMAELIDDLLDLARVTRAGLDVGRVAVAPVAAKILDGLRDASPEREVEVVLREGPGVWADPRLLRVVLENLIGNAWKFTSKTEKARIEIGVEESGTDRVLFVRDNGAGFDATYASKLFGVFQRLHSTAEFDGTGIGLATVQRIARRHGGSVEAEGAVGRGATIRLRLPEPVKGLPEPGAAPSVTTSSS